MTANDRAERRLMTLNGSTIAIQAAHEMRTPLAALRLELEEALTHRDAADPFMALKEALHSAERLENTMVALLRLLQRDASSQACGEHRWPEHGESGPTGP
ncbi:HAMP domain-containing histidine kinase [Actinomadura soli]|uniref:histidine kinase n=1 Tax=Actinomadura soli TaxID=2508997 RepID=A0A5C4JHG1_9ACTN|nr:histidine kinase dimerization/phospho-acceptor domain-containing protein [Actinomadura soli]TMR05692.1 HAMP domain-containing histidine kinase [Actinomadura soli]